MNELGKVPNLILNQCSHTDRKRKPRTDIKGEGLIKGSVPFYALSTLLGSAKTVCKPGASGAASPQPAQLPGPQEPESVGKVGRREGG